VTTIDRHILAIETAVRAKALTDALAYLDGMTTPVRRGPGRPPGKMTRAQLRRFRARRAAKARKAGRR